MIVNGKNNNNNRLHSVHLMNVKQYSSVTSVLIFSKYRLITNLGILCLWSLSQIFIIRNRPNKQITDVNRSLDLHEINRFQITKELLLKQTNPDWPVWLPQQAAILNSENFRFTTVNWEAVSAYSHRHYQARMQHIDMKKALRGDANIARWL